MIEVSQGHEKGIGLEVFFKSCICLSQYDLNQIRLHSFKKTIQMTLASMGIEVGFQAGKVLFAGKELPFKELKKSETPESTVSLLSALADSKPEDILITLPTSKDQLILEGQKSLGHTEFLRKFYSVPTANMCFLSEKLNMALLTDHIPLKDVAPFFENEEFVFKKLDTLVTQLEKYFPDLSTKFVISGLNPHAGEGGLLGNQEENLKRSLDKIRKRFPEKEFIGPAPGDTLHHYPDHFLVYAHHDQGLSRFKASTGFFSSNTTLGLPILRMSVDHGTAFEIFGKNIANYTSCHYIVQRALQMRKAING